MLIGFIRRNTLLISQGLALEVSLALLMPIVELYLANHRVLSSIYRAIDLINNSNLGYFKGNVTAPFQKHVETKLSWIFNLVALSLRNWRVLVLSSVQFNYSRIWKQESEGSMRMVLEFGKLLLQIVQHVLGWQRLFLVQGQLLCLQIDDQPV